MDQSPEVTFEDLKKEERYKKLQRNLKLAFVKQMEQAKAYIDKGYCTSPTWPSVSTINADGLDTTSGCPSLQVSRVESEVVSSSSNLHKILAMKRHGVAPMATSSVKKFPINDPDRDRAIMPPPPPGSLMYRHPKSVPEIDSKLQGAQSQLNKNHESQNVVSLSTSAHQSGSDNGFVKPYRQQDSSEHRVFQRWRVLLNSQGQLIVKGTLADCGKVARSKPIKQRISSNQVQSIYNHIYVLDGNILDERNELPEYVRGKFMNGFPDDWENVYQLWKKYVVEGSKVTFRWPTPITDSDDDLVTEITDFTYNRNKESVHPSNVTPNNATSSGYHSKSQSDSIQNVEVLQEEKVSDKVKQTRNLYKQVESLGQNFEVKDANGSKEHEDSSHTKDSLNLSNNCSNLKYSSYLYEILQEDKLRIIRTNLADKNCPPDYLDKFIELVNCLRYLLSFAPNNETDSKNQPQGCLKCSSTVSFSESQEVNPDEQPSNSRNKNEVVTHEKPEHRERVDPSKNPQSHENYNYNPKTPVHNNNAVTTDSSDSDTYMGIPNVSVNRVFKSKARTERYRDVKNRMKEKKNGQKEKQVEQEQQLARSVHDQKLQLENDSSVSVTEDEYDLRRKNKRNEDNRFLPIERANAQKDLVTGNVKYTDAANGAGITVIENLGIDNINAKQSTPKKRVIERPKPVVKSNELVNIDLKAKGFSRNPKPSHSDVSFLDDEMSAKRQKLSHADNVINDDNDEIDDGLNEDIMQHRFLTYDSEHFSENDDESSVKDKQLSAATKSNLDSKHSEAAEKSQTDKNRRVLQESPRNQNRIGKEQSTSSSKKKSALVTNEKAVKSQPFGSKENPKLLTSWSPCVMYENELKKKYNLTFEGKLLNEAGHVLHRKFVTDSILKRHSSKLVETVKNEYYMLVGEVNDTKHAVPKELLKLCRSGCPAKIKEFCEEWKRLKSVVEKPGKLESLHDASIDMLTLPTSSRGRKILPALNYWEGERMKWSNERETVYQAGDVLETSLMKIENKTPKKTLVSSEKLQNKKDNAKSSDRKSSVKPPIKPEKTSSTSKSKKRIVRQTKYSEDESSEADDRESTTNKKTIVSGTRAHTGEQKLPESTYNAKLRKRQKLEVKQSNFQQFSEVQNTKSRQRKSNVVWSLEKKQNQHDVLSDDQSSVIIK